MASTEVKKPSDSTGSGTALCKTRSSKCTQAVVSSSAGGPQSRQQAGNAGCDVSGVLSISSHALSRLPPGLSQPLPASADQGSLMQPVQHAASRVESSARLGNQKVQGDQRSSVRKAGVKLVSAGRSSQNAGNRQGTPCLQDIVGIAMGCSLHGQGQLQGNGHTTDRQKASIMGRPKGRGSFAKGSCSAVQPVDQELQCTAQGFHGMHGQGVCNPRKVCVPKPGTDAQLPSMQPAKSAAKVGCDAVREAKAHKATPSVKCDAQLPPVFETAGTKCSQLQ